LSPILPSTIVPPPPPPSCPAPPAARRRQPTPRSLPRASRKIGEIVAANRRRWTDPAAPEPRAPGGSPPRRAIAPVARRRHSPAPGVGGRDRSAGRRWSIVRRRVPSELAEGRASGERSVDFAPDERATPHRQSMRCDAMQCVFDLRVTLARHASRPRPARSRQSDTPEKLPAPTEFRGGSWPTATRPTPPRQNVSGRGGGGGEIRDRQATRTLAKRRQRRRLGQRTKERPACRSQSMPPIIVASHYRRSTIAQIRNNIGEVGGRGLGGGCQDDCRLFFHLPSPPPWRRRRGTPSAASEPASRDPPTAKNERAIDEIEVEGNCNFR